MKKFKMKLVSGAFKLPIQTVTLIPSTKHKDKKITPVTMQKRTKEMQRFLAKNFGGFTTTREIGGYVSKKDRLIKEKVIAVTAFATRPAFKKNKKKWLDFVKTKGKRWGQESMGIIIENDMFYVSDKSKLTRKSKIIRPTKLKLKPTSKKQKTKTR